MYKKIDIASGVCLLVGVILVACGILAYHFPTFLVGAVCVMLSAVLIVIESFKTMPPYTF